MSAPIFKPAVRRALKLKIGVQGPSGSGKTRGALAVATGLAQGGKIAVIDTENGSASYYADEFTFDTLDLRPPYTSARYLEAIKAAAEAGYAVVVVDSLSHQWAGSGGILERKDEADKRPGSNSYTNWAGFTKEHEQFKAGILNAPVHILVTMRAKQDYVVETNEKGKAVPRKVGMAPIQREGMEYEYGIVFELQMDHRAAVSKDRTKLFEGLLVDLLDAEVSKSLLGWLETAAPAEPPQPAEQQEELTPMEGADLTELLRTVASAGINKAAFPTWYERVVGRPFDRLIYWQDKLALEAEAAKIVAAKRSQKSQPTAQAGGQQ